MKNMLAGKSKEVVIKKETSTDEKIAFLQEPKNYPHFAEAVMTRETHMSVVFLVNGLVYKMKKPVQYDSFDHRRLESRRTNCREEVKINRQLAKDIYMGTVPLVINAKGALQLEAKGEVVEWLVKMKRIPEENMLDFAIRHNAINENYLDNAARLLIGFYKASPAISISVGHFIQKQEADVLSNYNRLASPSFELKLSVLKELTSGMMAFVAANPSLFEERVKKGKIIDAHGDLRPEHVCLAPVPAIIDRLEFSRELRIMDIAEELAFLSMECELIGNRSAGEFFSDEYIQDTGDAFPQALSKFYKIKKACLRAYLVARHIHEPEYRNDPKWLGKANAYLGLAEKYYQQLVG